jgi:hypothetical protein
MSIALASDADIVEAAWKRNGGIMTDVKRVKGGEKFLRYV